MSNIVFRPWVGSSYVTGGIFGKRIMVLGESHYCASKKDAVPSLTNDVVETYLDKDAEREGWMNTYLKFERSLVGHETSASESKRIWDSLLFYNYLQVAMTEPREAGMDAEYRAAEEPFFEVLEKFRPQYVIVWGQRLWNYLPGGVRWTWNPDIVVDGSINKCGNYALKDGTKVKVMAVNHPSTAYSWDYWHRVMMELMK